MRFIAGVENPGIILLRQPEVVQWILGDTSFLGTIQHRCKTADDEAYKLLEDKWGQSVMKSRRPDLTMDKQWTNRFGEYLCEEMFMLMGSTVSKPVKKNHYQPDLETELCIIEAKTGTYFTNGTAGEKILGCPFKYAEIPDLYGKPLSIICLGGAEKICRESYGNLPGSKCTPQKQRYLDFFRENGIEYVGASDILRKLSS